MIHKFERGAGEIFEISRSAALKHAEYLTAMLGKKKPAMSDFVKYIPRHDKKTLEKLTKDTEDAQRRQKKFEESKSPDQREVDKISAATEIVMLQIMEHFGSLGDRVYTSMTNLHDDQTNHVDAYAEIFEESDEDEEGVPLVVGFGFDFTTGYADAMRKFNNNIESIKRMKATGHRDRPHLDYFVSTKSEIDNHGEEVPVHAGYMEVVPVVIGVEHRHAKELNFLFFQLNEASLAKKHFKQGHLYDEKNANYKKTREQIMRHPVRHMIAEQIQRQLDKYRELLDENNEQDREYLEKIDLLQNVIYDALPGLDMVDKNEDWEKDLLHAKIKEMTQRTR